jgi:hypothetical protein
MDLNEAGQLRRELEAIEAVLRRVRALWQDLPSQEEVAELGKEAAYLAAKLEGAKGLWQSPGLPTEHDLAALSQEAGHLAGRLGAAKELAAELPDNVG